MTPLDTQSADQGTAAPPTDQQLLARFKAPLEALVSTHIRDDVDREKVYQYSQARKFERYWRGDQYLSPVLSQDGLSVVDWGVSGTVKSNGKSTKNQYGYSMNQIRGDGRKFIAVLGQRSPNVKAAPDKPDNETWVRRARKADSAAAFLKSAWKTAAKHRQLAMSLWKNGTTFAYTSWVANADKYGMIESPVYENRDVQIGPGAYRCFVCGTETPEDQFAGTCPNCGTPLGPENYIEPQTVQVPEVVDTQKFANGSVELRLCTIFSVTTPFYVEDIEDTPWLWYEYEEHKGSIIAAFPELADWSGEDGGNSSGITSQGRISRDLASSPTGNYIAPRKNRWTYSRFWLRPAMYPLVTDKTLRQELSENFPTGLKVTSVQGRIVRLEHERLSEVWSMCKPETSEYIYADPICKDYMPAQDMLNDMMNIGVEMWERAIPFTFGDPRVIDFRKFRDHAGLPGEMIPIVPGTGGQLRQAVYTPDAAKPDPQMMAFGDSMKEMAREVVGVLRPIFGADSGNQTATEAEQKRTQALMQLNTTWNEMRDFWAQVYMNGVLQLAKWGAVGIAINGSVLTDEEIQDMKELLDGGWHFEAEESMPMTWNQQRALFWSMLQMPPQAWSMLGLDHPMNASYIQSNLGLVGWKTPYLDARDKALDVIRQLLLGAPVMQPTPMGNQLVPSIPVDEFEDDHQFCVAVVKEWAQSEDGRRAKDANPNGYGNVIAWGRAHQMLVPPPMPGPEGSGGPQGTGGPPPMPEGGGLESAPQDAGTAAPPAQPIAA